MCLIPGKENEQCRHHGCMLAKKHPKYHGATIAGVFAERPEFSSFRIDKLNVISGKRWVMAVNPYNEDGSKAWSNFEFFRQAWILEAVGEWPADRITFDRSEVLVIFNEYDTWRTELNNLGSVVQIDCKDVHEVAVYCGDELIK